MVLFFLSWIARYHQYPPDKNGLDQKKTYLVLALTMLVEQWAEECSSLSHDLSIGSCMEAEGMKAKVCLGLLPAMTVVKTQMLMALAILTCDNNIRNKCPFEIE